LGLFRVIGQPKSELEVDRQAARAYQIQCGRRAGCHPDGGGGQRGQPGVQGEQRYDLVLRYQAPYRDTQEAIENIRLLAPSGERVSCAIGVTFTFMDGASDILP